MPTLVPVLPTLIDLTTGVVVLAGGEHVLIESMFDRHKNRTVDPMQATYLRAPMPDGEWLYIDLRWYDPRSCDHLPRYRH